MTSEPTVSDAVEELLRSPVGTPAMANPTVEDWLGFLTTKFRGMIERLLSPDDLASVSLLMRGSTRNGASGAAMSAPALRAKALDRARSASEVRVIERHVVEAVLESAGYRIRMPSPLPPLVRGPSTLPAEPTQKSHAPPLTSWQPRALRPTPALDQFGADLTKAAAEGRLAPMIGRQAELDRIVLTLCRRIKRNPMLVGAAGTGKTAIVEGLAQRIVDGQVPPLLAGARVVALQPSSLVAGASMAGEFEKRIRAVIAEASQDGILLFIDEVHTALGAGGMAGTQDFAQQLKPALARGDFACIAATTDDEHRMYIASDQALERRFDPIKVHEMTAAEARTVLERLRGDSNISRGVGIDDAALDVIIDFGIRHLRNRRFPDKAVDLFDQLVAAALTRSSTSVSGPDADRLLHELLGVRETEATELAELEHSLADRSLMTSEAASQLVDRLSVTTQGLDLQASRPNAIVLLGGAAAERADELAAVLAEAVFGSSGRVVSIDFATMVHEHSVTALLGSPPSYVGYRDRHALDGVAESPLSVVVARNVDEAHTAVRAAFAPVLDRGWVTDLRGRRIFFSDAIVLMTLGARDSTGPTRRIPGFGDVSGADLHSALSSPDWSALFGDRTAEYLDLVIMDTPATFARRSTPNGVCDAVLADVSKRFGARGISIGWDDSVVDWLQTSSSSNHMESIARLIEREVLPLLVAAAFTSDATHVSASFKVRRVNSSIEVTPDS